MDKKKNYLIISDSFLPDASACAILMTSLVEELIENGNECSIVSSIKNPKFHNSHKIKKIFSFESYFYRSKILPLRFIAELLNALVLASIFWIKGKTLKIDIAIVYSPSIFWAIFLIVNKKSIGNTKIILRDIFPYWLMSIGMLDRKSLRYKILDYFAKLQFKYSDKIFVQSNSDINLLEREYGISTTKLTLLRNWYPKSIKTKLPIELEQIFVNQKNIILLLGNFGVAQNRNYLSEVLYKFLSTTNGYILLFIGLKKEDQSFFKNKLLKFEENLIFLSQLPHDQCCEIAKKCLIGIISLHKDLSEGNFPGKFGLYALNGLPTFAIAPNVFEVSKFITNNNLGGIGDVLDIQKCSESLEKISHIKFSKEKIINFAHKEFDIYGVIKKLNH